MSMLKISSLLKNGDSEPCTLRIIFFVAVANKTRSREDFTLLFHTLELSDVHKGLCRKGKLFFLEILSVSVPLSKQPSKWQLYYH